MKKVFLSIVILLGIYISGCAIASSTSGGVVGVDRTQLMLVSAAQMEQGANESYKNVLQKAKNQNALNVNLAQTKRVQQIAKRIIPQVKVFRKDALNWDWQVNVIKSNTLNAWCMPGGKIAFYSAIIEKLNLSDDEIAAIMGHEISHALREHSREQASEAQLKNIGFSLASMAGISNDTLSLASLVAKYTYELPFSRSHEKEADKMGVELAARAGYDPSAAIRLWQKMSKISSSAPFEFMSTHPSNESRIKDLQVISKKVYPLYLKAKKS